MSSFVEQVREALLAYWLSPLSLTVLAVCGASMGTLLYVFLTNSRNAKLRVSLLTGLYALSIFFWGFVSGSLALCISQARMVAYAKNGVPLAVLGAVVGGLAASGIISAIVWKFGNAAILQKFAPRSPSPSESWTLDYVRNLGRFEGAGDLRVGVVETSSALAMAVGGKERWILLSTGLFDLLTRDEMETVLAHELMHLKHHDAEFKVFSRVLSRILFFDPLSKFFDPAVHREREYLADEMGGRSTGRPAALASALLKIADRGLPPKSAWGLSILGSGRGIFSRYPPLDKRIQRLVLLSDMLAGASQ
ncbi:MAG TPA: M48 family metalloprotease [Thermoplasmata archaeon]|jgi:heat shock protein HtpX|nr:M48 family metalloprotease [Thermoplasmata archaeon]